MSQTKPTYQTYVQKNLPEVTDLVLLVDNDPAKSGLVWFGDRFARQYTCSLNADEKGRWYDLLKQSGLTMHGYYRRDALDALCHDFWRVSVGLKTALLA